MTNTNPYGQTINGMLKKIKMLEAISKNILNINSIGYKREIPESLSFKSVLEKEAALRDNSQGQLKRTGNTFDIAIEGNAHFLTETKDGLTPSRNGRFHLNENGDLVTIEGDKVVIVEKTDKRINLALESEIKINERGEIIINNEKYGRLAIEVLDNKPVKVHQGFIEGSNINIMTEMASMSILYRSIEASEKALGMEASVDRDLIEKYGRNV